ncbi:RraA family protein [Variovorax boronicumulans]|uniref:RraA family protein n=1 Tax=Variovorax boronicumulans TaxID=436515 RepID=UPI001C59CD27
MSKPDSTLFETSTLHDAARRLGLEVGLDAVMPLAPGMRLQGLAYTVRFGPVDATPSAPLNFYDVIAHAPKGSVLVVQVGMARWVCGANMSRFAQLSGMAGMVLDGCVRDVAAIRTRGYPMFARGVAVRSYADALAMQAVHGGIDCGGIHIESGDVIVGDDDGVVALPASRLEDILYEADQIAMLDRKLAADIEGRRPLPELHATRLQWSVRRTAAKP